MTDELTTITCKHCQSPASIVREETLKEVGEMLIKAIGENMDDEGQVDGCCIAQFCEALKSGKMPEGKQ